jgi:hypothetical protein
VLSAIAVAEAGFPSYALLGTHLTSKGLGFIVDNYDKYLIWLDNDNPDVVRKARALYRRLQMFGDCGMIEYQGGDPKDHTQAQIKEIVNA